MAPKATSLWLDGVAAPEYPPREGEWHAEVVVVGAGIAGLTTALLLAEEGADVVVLEADRVGRGATGYTTAKVSSQHGLIYDSLTSSVGREHARLYGEANQAALELIARWVEERGIDCDFRRRDSYVYVPAGGKRSKAEDEATAAAALGLPAEFVDSTPLPYPVEGAVRFHNQAEFDAYRYVLGLAEAVVHAGGAIHEHTRATGVAEGSPSRVRTDRGGVSADQVVVASHFPFLDRALAFSRVFPERSYSIAARIDGDPPEGMFISSEGPTRSLRAAPRNGNELLLVGGEGHKVGQGGDTRERYAALESFARQHFEVGSVQYRWSTQDMLPADGIPYVGAVTPLSSSTYMATGFAKWGMTNGTVAAGILADAILGRENPWRQTFESNRLRVRAAAPKLVKENLVTGLHFAGDRVRQLRPRPLDNLAPGEGAIVSHDGETLAAYRDDDGKVTAVSPTCTHLWCRVLWNPAERSWDCPCHGSRFAPDGTVLQGPAVRDLSKKL
jgi:glycine/D-amino acid oxidase-like deaminating enzyme/nitrite reductase/ring-hydroxylating ferredoxin subunit